MPGLHWWRGGRGGGLGRRGGFFRGSRRRGGFLRSGSGRSGGRLGLLGAKLGGGRVAALDCIHARPLEHEDAVVGVVAPELGEKCPVSMKSTARRGCRRLVE